MKKLAGLSHRAETLLESAGSIFLIALTMLVFVQVVARPFGEGRAFMEEFSRWSQIWFVYLVLGVVERGRSHIAIDTLPRRLPERYKTALLILLDMVTLTFAILLFCSGVQSCQELMKIGYTSPTEVSTPMWIVRLCIPLGAAFLAFFSIEHLVRDIASLSKQGGSSE